MDDQNPQDKLKQLLQIKGFKVQDTNLLEQKGYRRLPSGAYMKAIPEMKGYCIRIEYNDGHFIAYKVWVDNQLTLIKMVNTFKELHAKGKSVITPFPNISVH